MTVALSDEVQQFIDEPNLAIFVTLMKNGSPQATMVWVDHDGEHVIINTPQGSQKDRNLARDRRVALCVIDRNQPRRYVQIRGRVVDVIPGEEAWEHINKLSHKYSGTDYPRRQERVKVIVDPLHVTAPRGSGRGDGQSGAWSRGESRAEA
jgi:PPOX class probable F420-dependent enzyme